MQDSITPGQIRQNNLLLIYHLIYNKKKISQQEICNELHLSRPTVTGILSQLEEKGLIRKVGFISTEQAGRKAAAYGINDTCKIALGAGITQEELHILAVNLYGEIMSTAQIPLRYENTDDYYSQAASHIKDFITSVHASLSSVLGLGVAMEAIVSPGGEKVIFGKALDNTGMEISALSRYLSFPCTLMRTSSSEAAAELWASPDMSDALYLSLSEHLGTALIFNRSIQTGKHGRSSSIEHLRMRSGGNRCYCGRTGCMETLLSSTSLLGEKEIPEEFFRYVRTNDEAYTARWNSYLTELSGCLHILHMMFDTDLILGGTISAYMNQDDLDLLYEKLSALSLYEEPKDYLHLSSIPLHDTLQGAALPYIWSFLGSEEL